MTAWVGGCLILAALIAWPIGRMLWDEEFKPKRSIRSVMPQDEGES